MPPEPFSTAPRMVTVEELGRFTECRLAWWYDHTHPLAHASADELGRRMDLMEAVYGPGAVDLPEYALLGHLRDAAQRIPAPAAQPPTPAPVPPVDSPRYLFTVGVVIALLVVAAIGFGVYIALVQR